jgi:hypothetical protein
MSEPQPMDSTALTPADVARLLSAAGGAAVPESLLRADLEVGAPANGDGTLNLVHYAAWLVRQEADDGA